MLTKSKLQFLSYFLSQRPVCEFSSSRKCDLCLYAACFLTEQLVFAALTSPEPREVPPRLLTVIDYAVRPGWRSWCPRLCLQKSLSQGLLVQGSFFFFFSFGEI